jgi:dTDP-L-rhamnose 4-epimerase
VPDGPGIFGPVDKTCLVTGGAGFIGCATTKHLLDRFDRVVAVDNLHPQVHATRARPADLHEDVELIEGDVSVPETWDELLQEVRPATIVHLAAETGTAQSLTEASRHATVNVLGTTQMTDALVRHDAVPERIVLTSSRAVYGEGPWADAAGAVTYPGMRDLAMLEAGTWDFPGLTSVPMRASETVVAPVSVYGATKLTQEHLLASWCGSIGSELVVFRPQNVYGPGQSLTNSYTGIVSLFAQLARAGEVIPVYEDGDIVRDFVFIDDAASALVAGATTAPGGVYDLGTGARTTIADLAELIAKHYGAPAPQVNGKFRHGDVRAASCDIAPTVAALDWEPTVDLAEGVRRLCDWIESQLPA